MTTEPDKTLTHSLRAVAIPNSRLLKTACFNKVGWYDFEYTLKLDLWAAFLACFVTFCHAYNLVP